MSLADEHKAAEASTKSFNLSNCYQEDVEHDYPRVQALSLPAAVLSVPVIMICLGVTLMQTVVCF